MSTLFSLFLLSSLLPLSFSYETRYAPNPNIRWITTLVSGLGLGVLMIIILLIVSKFVVKLMKKQARIKASSAIPTEDHGFHPHAAGEEKDSKERFAYYNRGMEPEEGEVIRGRGSAAQNPNVRFHNAPNSRVEMSSA